MGIYLIQAPQYDAKCDCCGRYYLNGDWGPRCIGDLETSLSIDGWSYNPDSGKVMCDDCTQESIEADSYYDDTYL